MDRYDINLKHLAYFIKVARLGSINKAAQLLYISQSHLGKIIHDLEENVGAPLLNRSRQGVTLTPEGAAFLEKAIMILQEMESLHFHPQPTGTQPETLSVSMTKFSHVMESFISVVQKYSEQPEFTHRLYEGQVDEVIDDVLAQLWGSDFSLSRFGGKKEIFVTGRASLMNLISQTDFYSIGIHDFDKQLSGFSAVSLPIPGCEIVMEFGYITLNGVPISQIGQNFLREVKIALSRAQQPNPG